MSQPRLISAIGTPLKEDESLHRAGLEAHLEAQWQAGIDGVLVAGTMGLMQLLTGDTYRQLIEATCKFAKGKGEVMLGVGDTSFVRTRERILLANEHPLDAVVALSPYFIQFSQEDLVCYFRSLADISKHPLFLYDLPVRTHTKLSFETVEQLAQHPNIHGIKCSCELEWTLELRSRVAEDFRVIVAHPKRLDELIGAEIPEHLDGIFAMAPQWTAAIRKAAVEGEVEEAARQQDRLNELLDLLVAGSVFPPFTAILNACGVPGNFSPAPYRQFIPTECEALLAMPIVQDLLAECGARA